MTKEATQYKIPAPVFDDYNAESPIQDALGSRRTRQRQEASSIRSTNYKKGESGWKIGPLAIEATLYGIVAPTGVPTHIGAMYVDTVTGKLYFAKGLTTSDWVAVN